MRQAAGQAAIFIRGGEPAVCTGDSMRANGYAYGGAVEALRVVRAALDYLIPEAEAGIAGGLRAVRR